MDTHNIATTLNTPILLVLLATISFCTGATNIAAAAYVSRRLAQHQSQHFLRLPVRKSRDHS